MGSRYLLIFTGKSSFRGFLGDAGFRPCKVGPGNLVLCRNVGEWHVARDPSKQYDTCFRTSSMGGPSIASMATHAFSLFLPICLTSAPLPT